MSNRSKLRRVIALATIVGTLGAPAAWAAPFEERVPSAAGNGSQDDSYSSPQGGFNAGSVTALAPPDPRPTSLRSRSRPPGQRLQLGRCRNRRSRHARTRGDRRRGRGRRHRATEQPADRLIASHSVQISTCGDPVPTVGTGSPQDVSGDRNPARTDPLPSKDPGPAHNTVRALRPGRTAYFRNPS